MPGTRILAAASCLAVLYTEQVATRSTTTKHSLSLRIGKRDAKGNPQSNSRAIFTIAHTVYLVKHFKNNAVGLLLRSLLLSAFVLFV